MEIKYEIITPEIAKKYLEQNKNNYRRINPSKVAVYARDMELGLWQNNGESIKFNKSGTLLDGQHRLSAVVRSGCSIPMLVCYEIDDSVTIMDIGMGRTASQILRASGLGSSAANNTATGMANIIISGSFGGAGRSAACVSKADCIDFVKNNSDFVSAAVQTSDWNEPWLLRKAPILAAIFLLIRVGEPQESVRQFCHVVNSGYPAADMDCSPCISLRNLLLAHKSRNAVSPKDKEMEFCATLKAYSDYKSGAPRSTQYRPHDCIRYGLRFFKSARQLLGLAPTVENGGVADATVG